MHVVVSFLLVLFAGPFFLAVVFFLVPVVMWVPQSFNEVFQGGDFLLLRTRVERERLANVRRIRHEEAVKSVLYHCAG